MSGKLDKFKERTAKGEKIGGGFLVFRRYTSSGRIFICPTGVPFECASIEQATAQAKRLSELNPGKVFCVFGEFGSCRQHVPDNGGLPPMTQQRGAGG